MLEIATRLSQGESATFDENGKKAVVKVKESIGTFDFDVWSSGPALVRVQLAERRRTERCVPKTVASGGL